MPRTWSSGTYFYIVDFAKLYTSFFTKKETDKLNNKTTQNTNNETLTMSNRKILKCSEMRQECLTVGLNGLSDARLQKIFSEDVNLLVKFGDTFCPYDLRRQN